MIPSLRLFLLHAALAAGVTGAAAWLSRPIPWRLLAAFLLLPVLFLLPAFAGDRTVFPVDHAMNLPPWSALPHTRPANPNLNDVATEMAPWAKAVRMAWKEGSLPWRNRWNACGSPLAANGQSAAFSPLTFLMFALPLAHAFNFAAAVKLFLALSGTWLWLSELGLSKSAALFGSILFGFSFAIVPWLLFPHSAVICLWPWALFAVERLRSPDRRRRAFVALVAVFLFWFLAGHPESAALGALFVGVWLAARLLLHDLEEPRRILFGVAAAGVLAAGLASFLLVPQLLAIRDSNRAVTALEFWKRLPRYWLPHGPAFPYGAFTLLLPRALGDSISSPMLPIAAGSFPEMAQGHFGVVGLAGALLVLRPGSRRRRSGLALLAPLLAGLATGILLWPVFEIFFSLPAIKLMMPTRYFTWVALAGSALAAFEIDRLRRDLQDGRARAWPLALSSIAVLLLAGAVFVRVKPLVAAAGSLVPQRRALAGAVVLLASAAAAGAAFSVRRLRAAPAGLVVVLSVLAAVELFWQGRRLYRFGSTAEFYPPTPLVEFLAKQPRPFRVLGEGPVLYPSTHVFAGLEDVRIHDPVERREYVDFLNGACGYDPNAFFKHVANVDCAALDFLNVKYLVATPRRAPPGPRWRRVYSGEDGTVFENTRVLPRAFGQGPNPVHVSDYRETTNSVTFRAEAPPDGATVVASLVSDGGWRARDENGSKLRTGRANGPFLTIAVPGGDHRVRLAYLPPGLPAGAAISLVSLLSLLVVTVARRRRL